MKSGGVWRAGDKSNKRQRNGISDRIIKLIPKDEERDAWRGMAGARKLLVILDTLTEQLEKKKKKRWGGNRSKVIYAAQMKLRETL